MMNNQNLIRGLFLMAIALAFGLQSFHYSIGDLARAGPGLFPLLVSGLLLLVGLAMVVRAYFTAPVRMDFQFKNIAIILLSLCGFAEISEHINMIAGIVFLVFFAGLAGRDYSVMRSLKIAVGLVVVAVVFQKFLGLQLPLYGY